MSTTSLVCQSCGRSVVTNSEVAVTELSERLSCSHCGHVNHLRSTPLTGADEQDFSGSTQVLKIGVTPVVARASSRVDVSARLDQATKQFGIVSAPPAHSGLNEAVTTGEFHQTTTAALKGMTDDDDFSGNHTTSLHAPPISHSPSHQHQPLTVDMFKDALFSPEPELSQASAARRPTLTSPARATQNQPSVTLFEASGGYSRSGNTWLKMLLVTFIIVAVGAGVAACYLYFFAPKKGPHGATNQVVQPAPTHLLPHQSGPRPGRVK